MRTLQVRSALHQGSLSLGRRMPLAVRDSPQNRVANAFFASTG
jgi:hypothetical protein